MNGAVQELPKGFICVGAGHNEETRGAAVDALNEYSIASRTVDSLQMILAPKAFPLIRIPSFPGTAKDSLNKKIKFCNAFGDHMICAIEIHWNAYHGQGRAHGTETLVSDDAAGGSLDTMAFAQILQKEMVRTLETRDRGIKTEDQSHRGTLAFLRFIHQPSMIFEVGFLTDPSDRNLANSEGREKTAVGLARALQEIHRRG